MGFFRHSEEYSDHNLQIVCSTKKQSAEIKTEDVGTLTLLILSINTLSGVSKFYSCQSYLSLKKWWQNFQENTDFQMQVPISVFWTKHKYLTSKLGWINQPFLAVPANLHLSFHWGKFLIYIHRHHLCVCYLVLRALTKV